MNPNTEIMDMENNATANANPFELAIAGTINDDFDMEELSEDSAGLQMNFQRIKIPAGGMLQFELPSDNPERPDYAPTVDGIILYNHAANTLWAEGSENDDDALPLCQSQDGVKGTGDPGGACAACVFNAWGSGKDGRGKACKNSRALYILRSGEFIPILLNLPPTSIRPFNDFFNTTFAQRRRGTCGSLVSIGLKREEKGGNTYSVATFRRIMDFTGQELADLKQFTATFKQQVKDMNEQRAADVAAQQQDGFDDFQEVEGLDDIFPADSQQALDSGSFSISSADAEIDGDRQALPA